MCPASGIVTSRRSGCARSAGGCPRGCRRRPRLRDADRAISECSSRRRNPQHGCGDVAPHGERFRQPVGRREWQLVPRIRREARALRLARALPSAQQGNCLVARKPRVVLLQAVGDGVEARIGRELLLRSQRIEPRGDLPRRGVGFFRRNAEAFERDHRAHSRRTRARVMHHDVAAEAVADEVRRLAGRERVEQRFEIGDIIGKPVALRLPRAAAVATLIRRNRMPFARERVDQELERRADVHPAMQQEKLRRRADRPTSARDARVRADRCNGYERLSPRSRVRQRMRTANSRAGPGRRIRSRLQRSGRAAPGRMRHFFLQMARPSCHPVR